MRKARKYLKASGCKDIQDTSVHKSCDFVCRNGRGKLYVEVKGTRGYGSGFPITMSEKRHLERHAGQSLVLVVHSIGVRKAKRLRATGGKVRPWPARKLLDVAKFTPTQFMVRLPG
jgi:hypothetical protein